MECMFSPDTPWKRFQCVCPIEKGTQIRKTFSNILFSHFPFFLSSNGIRITTHDMTGKNITCRHAIDSVRYTTEYVLHVILTRTHLNSISGWPNVDPMVTRGVFQPWFLRASLKQKQKKSLWFLWKLVVHNIFFPPWGCVEIMFRASSSSMRETPLNHSRSPPVFFFFFLFLDGNIFWRRRRFAFPSCERCVSLSRIKTQYVGSLYT